MSLNGEKEMRGRGLPFRRARGRLSLSLGDLCTQYPPPVTEHNAHMVSEV